MNLESDISAFRDWLHKTFIPEFQEAYKNSPLPKDLQDYASEMRDAVKLGNEPYYREAKNMYLSLYKNLSIALCKKKYEDILENVNSTFQLSTLEAESMAAEECWKDPILSYWLPLSALLKDTEGREVLLVSRKEHAKKGKSYVTISELNELETSGKDPWEFVNKRGA